MPRYLDTPENRIEDIRSAVDYLVSLDYVDENRIMEEGQLRSFLISNAKGASRK